jgi:hypothetical protein
MAEPFSFLKAFDFSGAAIGKSVSVVIKGLLILGLVGLFIWMCYVTFVKPHTKPTPTTTNTAQVINNYFYNFYPNKKVFGLGGSLWGMDIGIAKYDYPKEPNTITKQTVIK